jgi:hypothetical protein
MRLRRLGWIAAPLMLASCAATSGRQGPGQGLIGSSAHGLPAGRRRRCGRCGAHRVAVAPPALHDALMPERADRPGG